VKYETTNEGKSVSWMQFSVSVTAPASFQPASGMDTKNIACPSNLGKSRLESANRKLEIHLYGNGVYQDLTKRPHGANKNGRQNVRTIIGTRSTVGDQ
jgi:hypothetical protein